jgi:hypothetical protein
LELSEVVELHLLTTLLKAPQSKIISQLFTTPLLMLATRLLVHRRNSKRKREQNGECYAPKRLRQFKTDFQLSSFFEEGILRALEKPGRGKNKRGRRNLPMVRFVRNEVLCNQASAKALTGFLPAELEYIATQVSPFLGPLAKRSQKMDVRDCTVLFLRRMRGVSVAELAVTTSCSTYLVSTKFYLTLLAILSAFHGIISWPTAAQRKSMAALIPALLGCFGYLDGTLVPVKQQHKAEAARRARMLNDPKLNQFFPDIAKYLADHIDLFFSGKGKLHCLNHNVGVDLKGKVIYLKLGFPGSFTDKNMMENAWFFREDTKAQYFSLGQYLLTDAGFNSCDHIVAMHNKSTLRGAHAKTLYTHQRRHRVLVEFVIGFIKHAFPLCTCVHVPLQRAPLIFHAAALLYNLRNTLRNTWPRQLKYMMATTEEWERAFCPDFL